MQGKAPSPIWSNISNDQAMRYRCHQSESKLANYDKESHQFTASVHIHKLNK